MRTCPSRRIEFRPTILRTGNASSLTWVRGGIGKALLGDADILSAYRSNQDCLPKSGDLFTGGEIMFVQVSVEALVLAGEKDEAAKLYPLLRRYFESPSSRVVFLYGLQEKSAAIAAAASTVWENAERHFENSLKLAEELPHRVDQASLRYWYARMLLDRAQAGDREQAQALLAEARSLSEQMGMHGLIRRIDELRP